MALPFAFKDLQLLLSIESCEWFSKCQGVRWICWAPNISPCKTWKTGAHRVQNAAKYVHPTFCGLNDFSYLAPSWGISPSAPHKQIGCNLNWLRLLFFQAGLLTWDGPSYKLFLLLPVFFSGCRAACSISQNPGATVHCQSPARF